MTVMYCDITKKEIKDGMSAYAWRTRDRVYQTTLGLDTSAEGQAQLEEEIRKEMGKHERFSFKEYKKTYAKKLRQMSE